MTPLLVQADIVRSRKNEEDPAMSRLARYGCTLTVFRNFDFRVGLWGAAMVTLAGCGSASSGASQNPGQEAGATQFSDAAIGSDGSVVAPGSEAGATVVDGGASDGGPIGPADGGETDSTLGDGSPADGGAAG